LLPELSLILKNLSTLQYHDLVNSTLLKQKHKKRTYSGPVEGPVYRNGTKDVLFWNQNVLYLKKMFFFQEHIMIWTWKSNIFDTFSVLDLNSNKKNNFSKIVLKFEWPLFAFGWSLIKLLQSLLILTKISILHRSWPDYDYDSPLELGGYQC
jgi:hypothetical protein